MLVVERLSVQVGQTLVCRELDLNLGAGEHWGMLGGNGVGKTTLLHTLAGLRPPRGGRIMLHDKDLRDYRRRRLARRLGVLFQDSQDTFPATVMETVLTGRFPYQSLWPGGSSTDLNLAAAALAQLNLASLRERQVDTLSGGERRRLAIATLLLQEPELWLLDEPTNHLDYHYQIQVLDLLSQRVSDRNGSLLMVLHDVNLISRYCTHAILMPGEGELLCGEVAAVMNRSNLENLYRHPIRVLSDGGRNYYFPA